MNFPFFIVDAFTNVPFGGNPAAVCIVEQDIDAACTLAQSCLPEEFKKYRNILEKTFSELFSGIRSQWRYRKNNPESSGIRIVFLNHNHLMLTYIFCVILP